jgi:hypothetical protein
MNVTPPPPPPLNDAPTIDDDEENELDEGLLPPSLGRKKIKNWPHVKKLCTNDKHKSILWKMLRQVDECKCTSEYIAINSDNVKGNCWSHLFDNFFGGGTPGRGLLAGHFPLLQNVSKLKIKIEHIWKFLKMNENSTAIDRQIIRAAVCQFQEYEKTKTNATTATEKQKQSDAKILQDMTLFEGGLGALPPGAQGIVGGGRRQHSTNLKTNQPAAYFYAHHDTTLGEESEGVENDLQPKKKAKLKVKVKSSTAPATSTLSRLEKLGKGIKQLLDPDHDKKTDSTAVSKRKRALYEKQATLKNTISFYKEFPADENTQAMMKEEMKEFMQVSAEIKALLDEEAIAATAGEE